MTVRGRRVGVARRVVRARGTSLKCAGVGASERVSGTEEFDRATGEVPTGTSLTGLAPGFVPVGGLADASGFGLYLWCGKRLCLSANFWNPRNGGRLDPQINA